MVRDAKDTRLDDRLRAWLRTDEEVLVEDLERVAVGHFASVVSADEV